RPLTQQKDLPVRLNSPFLILVKVSIDPPIQNQTRWFGLMTGGESWPHVEVLGTQQEQTGSFSNLRTRARSKSLRQGLQQPTKHFCVTQSSKHARLTSQWLFLTSIVIKSKGRLENSLHRTLRL